jgi:hypothetical protein
MGTVAAAPSTGMPGSAATASSRTVAPQTLGNVEAGAAVPAPAPIAAPAPAAEPEPPYSAERDPQLIADVKAAYDEAMKRVEARVLGMTTSSADRVRKTEKEKIIKTIATKLDMTVDQVLSMISSP